MALRLGLYFWKLFLANAVVMALVLAGSVWLIVSQLDRFREEELSRHLLAQASALEVAVRDRFDPGHAQELNAVAQQVGSTEVEGVRVTFILADGTVLGDSEANASEMESHADRPEIQQALASGSGESVRWSHTVAKNMKYVTVRVGTAGDPRGVIRVSMAVQSIAARAEPAQRLAVAIALLAVLAAILLALALAILWSRPIQRVTDAARSISDGDLLARIDVVGNDEVAVLGRSLNIMRENLSTHLSTIDRQRRTLDSLLSQLREGVVVADADGRIVLINPEAVGMFQPTQVQSDGSHVGRTVEQCVPNRKLQELLRPSNRPASSDSAKLPVKATSHEIQRIQEGTHEIELKLSTPTGDRTVLARAFDVRLPAATANDSSPATADQVGRALMLTDITELARVMQIKADLAANASHELRTPLSAIRAAVDTLHSIEPREDPEATAQFIEVIDRHSGRMEAMIGDLLDLSRLESGTSHFHAASVSAKALLEDLRASFADAISAKNLRWSELLPSEDFKLTASSELLTMILRNVIDNAIRFTDSGGEISVSVSRKNETVVFEIADTGCGIAPKEQQRIFERFYQVEQARSGADRGTGLGLSIVRHALAAINGHIALQSSLGHGTRISIRIPSGLDK